MYACGEKCDWGADFKVEEEADVLAIVKSIVREEEPDYERTKSSDP